MICASLSSTIGFTCDPLNEDGSVAIIDTPFTFPDGEVLPVFIERTGNLVRFFDDGGTLLHLRGKGMKLNDMRNLKPIRNVVEADGAAINDMGEVEVWAKSESAPEAFAKFMAALMAVSNWERQQEGSSTDVALFLDEVVLCIRAWKPSALIGESQEYAGISGAKYRLDFDVDGQGIIAIAPHPNSVSSTARKLLDIRALDSNSGRDILVVLDDRRDPVAAKREGSILDSVGNVLMMTRLEKNSRIGTTLN